MARAEQERNRDRIKAIAGVAVFHALLGYALIAGLGLEVPKQVSDTFKVFDVPQEQIPPPIEEPPPPQAKAEEPEGAASPPNLRSKPTPVVAPPPEIRLKVPSPVVTAPRALPVPPGNDPSAGGANIAGPGTGSGGTGVGTGSGGSGTGSGAGLAAGVRRERGAIVNADYPAAARKARASGTVHVRISVGANGDVTGCSVTRSSGNEALDATTCRLIERRFRYRPATDAQGRPIAGVETTNFTWTWVPR